MVMVMGLLLSGANRLGVKAAAPGGGALFAQRRNALGAFAAHAGGKQAGRVVEQRALVFLAAATQQGLEPAVGARSAGAQAREPLRQQRIERAAVGSEFIDQAQRHGRRAAHALAEQA